MSFLNSTTYAYFLNDGISPSINNLNNYPIIPISIVDDNSDDFNLRDSEYLNNQNLNLYKTDMSDYQLCYFDQSEFQADNEIEIKSDHVTQPIMTIKAEECKQSLRSAITNTDNSLHNLNDLVDKTDTDIHTLFNVFRSLCSTLKPINLITGIVDIVYSQDYKACIAHIVRLAECYDIIYNDFTDHIVFAKFIWMQCYSMYTFIKQKLSTDEFTPQDKSDSEEQMLDITKLQSLIPDYDPPLLQSTLVTDETRMIAAKELLTKIGLPNLINHLEPFGAVISILVTSALGLYVLFTGNKASFNQETIVRLLSSTGLHTRNLTWLKSSLVDTFKTIREFFFSLFGYTYVPQANSKAQDLIDRAHLALKSAEAFLIRFRFNPSIISVDPSEWRAVVSAIQECDTLFTDYARAQVPMANSKALIDELKNMLKELKSIERDTLAASSVKFDPITIYLHGESGVGKSQFRKYLVEQIGHSLGRELTTYIRNIHDQYSSGYENQAVWAYDEFGTKGEGDEVEEWAGIATEAATKLNMAALDDKGKAFSSQFITICSNHPFIDKCAKLNRVDHLPRRVFINIECCNPAYKEYRQTHNDTPSSTHPMWKADYSHLKFYKHSVFPDRDQEARNPATKENCSITIEDMVTLITKEYHARFAKFQAAIEAEWCTIQKNRYGLKTIDELKNKKPIFFPRNSEMTKEPQPSTSKFSRKIEEVYDPETGLYKKQKESIFSWINGFMDRLTVTKVDDKDIDSPEIDSTEEQTKTDTTRVQYQCPVVGLLGPTGVGKTHLATDLLNSLAFNPTYNTFSIHVKDLPALQQKIMTGNKQKSDNPRIRQFNLKRTNYILDIDDVTTSFQDFENFRQFVLYITTVETTNICAVIFTGNETLIDQYFSGQTDIHTEFERRVSALRLDFKRKSLFKSYTLHDIRNIEPNDIEMYVDIKSVDGKNYLRSFVPKLIEAKIEHCAQGVSMPTERAFATVQEVNPQVMVRVIAPFREFSNRILAADSILAYIKLKEIVQPIGTGALNKMPQIIGLIKKFKQFGFSQCKNFMQFFKDLQNAHLTSEFNFTIQIDTLEGIFYVYPETIRQRSVMTIAYQEHDDNKIFELQPESVVTSEISKLSTNVITSIQKSQSTICSLMREMIKVEIQQDIPKYILALGDITLLGLQLFAIGFSISTLIKRTMFNKCAWDFGMHFPGVSDSLKEKFESSAICTLNLDNAVLPTLEDLEQYYEENPTQLQQLGKRKVAYYGQYPYSYSGINHKPQAYPPIIEQIRSYFQVRCKIDWNGVIVNRYDGKWQMPPHKDNEPGIGPNILSFNLGADAYFNIKGQALLTLTNNTAYFFTEHLLSNCTHSVKGQGLRYNITLRTHSDITQENADPSALTPKPNQPLVAVNPSVISVAENADPAQISPKNNQAPQSVNVQPIIVTENADPTMLIPKMTQAPIMTTAPSITTTENIRLVQTPGMSILKKLAEKLKVGQTPLDDNPIADVAIGVPIKSEQLHSTSQIKTTVEAIVDQNASDVVAQVFRNYVSVISNSSVHLCFGLMVCDRLGATVAHVEHHALVPGLKNVIKIRTMDGKIFNAKIRGRGTERDLLIFELDRTANQFPNILKHISDAKHVINLQGKTALMPTIYFNQIGDQKYALMMNKLRLGSYVPPSPTDIASGHAYTGYFPRVKETVTVGTTKGECGSAIVLDGPNIKERIVAIHRAANTVDGYATDLYQSDFKPFIVTKQSVEPELDISYNNEKLGNLELYQHKVRLGNSLFVGEAFPPNHQPGTTTLWKSPLGPPWIPIYHEPTILVNSDTRLPRDFVDDIRMQGIRKWDVSPAQNFSVDNSIEAMQEIIDYYASLTQQLGKPLYKLTKTEAINSVSEFDVSRAINRSSSAGYPWSSVVKRSGKHEFFKFDEERKIHLINLESDLGRSLNASIDRLIDECRHERTPIVIFQSCLKDEVRPINRVRETPKTRVFTPAPLDAVLAHRMYYHAAVAVLRETRHYGPIQVGIDPLSREWDTMMLRLLEKGQYAFDGDYGDFDARHPSFVVMFPSILYRTLYAMFDPKCTYEDDQIRHQLDASMRHPYIQLSTELLQFPGGIFSGKPTTTDDNSYINLFYLYYAWRILCEKQQLEKFKSIHMFFQKVALVIFGDDNQVHPSSDVIKWYNLETISQVLLDHFNVKLNNSDKTEQIIPYQNYKQCQFLKRYHRQIGDRIVGVFCDKTFSKMLHWTNAGKRHHYYKDENIEYYDLLTLEMTALCALRDATVCGGPFFRRLHSFLQKKLFELGSTELLPNLKFFCTQLELSYRAVENLVHEDLPLTSDGLLWNID